MINLGTRGSRTFVPGHIVSGSPVTPPFEVPFQSRIQEWVYPFFCHWHCSPLPTLPPAKIGLASTYPQRGNGWGDGTSRNDMSPYECSGTPGPQIIRPLWHNVPVLIHLSPYPLYNTFRLAQNDWDVSMQGHCASGTIHLGDQGSQKICSTTHRFGTSHHPPENGGIDFTCV